ncbi:hypothetical protein [Actinopolymorpha alba]|uniref:hypothetical protein n=1 Tax=Actinopolymorpha alba TaxID=533267 RepID=UPI00035FB3F6|nr:hypothetical protein [Actinopolymorpha alba]
MISNGFDGILRDLGELSGTDLVGWLLLAGLALLPIVGVLLILGGSRLAWIPVAVFAALMVLWFLYYATNWWSNPGIAGAALPALAVMISWIVLGVSAWSLHRRRHRPLTS